MLLNAYIAQPINEHNRDSARIEKVLEEKTVDINEDGYAEELVIKVQIEVVRSGSYELKGYLNNQKGEPITFDIFNTTMQAAEGKGSSTLKSGTHQVLLSFSGQQIHSNNDDGPYHVLLFLNDPQEYIQYAELDTQQYVTAPYRAALFR